MIRCSAVGRFFKLLALLIVTTILLCVSTLAQQSDGGAIEVAGMPMVCVGSKHPCWIAIGGYGVVALGAGVGVIEYGLYGAGILFGTGQVCAGLIAMGQVGVGLLLYLGQAGFGFLGFGQGVGGWMTHYQGGDKRDGREFGEEIRKDLRDLFAFRSTDSTPTWPEA